MPDPLGLRGHRRRRTTVGLTLSALTLAVGATGCSAGSSTDDAAPEKPVGDAAALATSSSTPTRPDRPNVLLVTTDDLSAEELQHLPRVQELLVDRGATFDGSIAPTPLCAPARASLLTGQYAHNHDVKGTGGDHLGGVKAFDDSNALPVWLQDAGYDTLFLGKYINGYGNLTNNPDRGPRYVPPGWDEWHATVGKSTYDYARPRVNHNGEVEKHRQYTTDLFTDLGEQLLTEEARTERPWFMSLNYVAPHSGAPRDPDDPQERFPYDVNAWTQSPSPAEQDRGRFAGARIPEDPSLFRPAEGSRTPVKEDSANWRTAMESLYAERLETMQSVDRGVARLVETLRRTGQLDRTVIVFTSDNGYSLGQHLKDGKVFPWDNILRLPTVVAGPGVPHRTVSTAITNPDLATTIAALAQADPQLPQDGVDIWPLLGEREARDRVVPIEAYVLKDGRKELYRGVRTDTWTYADHTDQVTGDRWEEVYDRVADPYETRNVADDPAYADQVAQLRELEERYADCRGEECPSVTAEPGERLLPGPTG